MLREPAVAGQFYPARASALRAMIAGFVDDKAAKENVLGLVSPHAGYIYSGSVAGETFSRIKPGDTFVIMGPNHTGLGKPFSIMTEGIWRTPLGDAEIDSELGGRILASSAHLAEDTSAHLFEHSVEVQIPFLQYFNPKIKIVPMVLSYAPGEIYKEIGRGLASAIAASKRKVVIVASSDMTHYEPAESAQRKDNLAIGAILDFDADRLLKLLAELWIPEHSMCGFAPAVVLITAAKKLGASGAELVKYQTSGDATGDYASVVGYAGIIIKAAGG